MISALDSSVLLDVLTADRQFADSSEALIRRGALEGKLVVCEVVLAEIFPAFQSPSEIRQFIADWHLEFVPASEESSLLAGAQFASFLQRGGKGGRVVADFLIGAHAQVQADRLIARDRGYWRDYFKKLVVLDPSHS